MFVQSIKYLKAEQKNKKKFVFFQKFAIFVVKGDR